MSNNNATPAPIIVIKKKGGHGGHHGGAWKVAYADFVTAMMAFFMVMWLLNSGEKVKEAVAGYFNDPAGYKGQMGTGLSGMGESLSLTKDNMPQLKEMLEKSLREMPQFQSVKDQVKMTVTGEGLRIELLETEKGMFFDSGSPVPTSEGRALLEKIGRELSKLPNTLLIEGHTDSRPFSGQGYGNWELSADRANTARKVMQANGVRPDQVMQVRGFADRSLFKQEDSAHESNRRISIIVRYRDVKPAPDAKGSAPDAASGHGTGGHGDAGHGAPAPAGGHGAPAAAEHAPTASPHSAAAAPAHGAPTHAAPAHGGH